MKGDGRVKSSLVKVLFKEIRELDREHRQMKAENRKQADEILAWGKLRKWNKGKTK